MEALLEGPLKQDDPRLIEWTSSQFHLPSHRPYNLDYYMSGLLEEFNTSNPYSPSQEFILEAIADVFSGKVIGATLRELIVSISTGSCVG